MKRAILTLSLLTAIVAAGCTSPASINEAPGLPSEFVLAFSVKDDFTTFVTKTQPLADWITTQTGVPTRILAVDDESASIVAIANGQAHGAFMDAGAAWIGWTTFGIEAIAADVNSDGRTNYTATAWVRADSNIQTVDDLRGVRSCHTGELKSAGMLVPMGYLIGHDLIDMSGLNMNDIASLQKARERFFSSSVIGGGYSGALQCLSTDVGDVAFVKDSTWNDYCAGEKAESWCLDRAAFRMLPEGGFAQVPSHPVMVGKGLNEESRAALRDALVALNDNEEGRAILKDVLGTPAIEAVDTAQHLSSYGDALRHVPGITAYLQANKFA